ncbi:MFS transporter [Micromonospora sp. NPDC049559]|uniref:MFS transporter n=1 Tax=Micromonospora sp. NPDC049559 TaxID=3155923 RepID=UPI003444C981
MSRDGAVALSPRQAQRRYLGLSGVRWFASGLMMPVQLLLYTARGLDLPTAGLLVALYSALIVLLELPTGGLADLIGRRRTMLVSIAAYVTAMLGLALAQHWWQFAVAVTLSAIGRALGSGPLDAWYVDTVRAADPAASLRAGLSRGWAVEALGLGLAATVGGSAPRLFSGLPADGLICPFSVPALGAAAVGAVSFVAHLVWMTEPAAGNGSVPRPAGGLRSLLRAVPGQVSDGVRLAVGDPVIRLLFARTAAIGVAVVSIEVLSPLQFAALLGGAERAAAAYGLLVTAAWAGSAAGSVGAPLLCRLGAAVGLRQPLAVGALFTGLIATGPALLALAAFGSGGLPVAVAGYLLAYLCAGVPGPLADEALHERVGEGQRATLVSVGSLALQLGGLGGSLGVARLADRAGFGSGWLVAGAALLLAAGFTAAALRRTLTPAPSTAVPGPGTAVPGPGTAVPGPGTAVPVAVRPDRPLATVVDPGGP